MNTYVWICANCRYVTKSNYWNFNKNNPEICPTCNSVLQNMGYKWRPPKKNNDKAWNRIQSGDFWWENERVVKNEHLYCLCSLCKLTAKVNQRRNHG